MDLAITALIVIACSGACYAIAKRQGRSKPYLWALLGLVLPVFFAWLVS